MTGYINYNQKNTKMIYKNKVGKMTVFVKDNDRLYENILRDFLSYQIKIKKVFRSEEETKVWLIDTERGPMVLKLYVPKVRKAERVLKSLVKRDIYQSLIYKTDNAISHGADFINDIYLIAQVKTLNYVSVHIILMEYLDGSAFSDLDEQATEALKPQIKKIMQDLHAHNMVSDAPHQGNLMLTKQGIKLIDLSGKSCNITNRAKDRIELEKYFNIKNEQFDLGYYIYTYRKNLKLAIRNLKIKLGLSKKKRAK